MNDLLEQINSPADLKKLTVEQLGQLTQEIRRFIVETVSRTGGHLASNLGVVELTIALHYVFDFAEDKLLWDVGHQCYTHKIITGRKAGFAHLRQAGGVSGFPDPAESLYDQFAVGHAGTSVATAIGLALGRQRQNQGDKIVAVVGDGSIVNGTSFEALNNLGLVKRQLLIVLNDNSMAIDPTQGALAKYFSKIRLSQTYEDLRRTTANILEHTPVIGRSVEEAIERLKKSIRMAMPASQIFESLNIPYFGPVDGHDIESLVELFRALRQLNHPAILHVYTKKGRGFTPAEQDGCRFHSTGPFTMDGICLQPAGSAGRPTFTAVFGKALAELAEKDNRIVAITSAMCDGTGLGGFRQKFPDRFLDVGIAESAAVAIAAGLARTGLKPVVCIYSTFLQRSFDQIFQEVALQKLPVVFCIDRAGLVGPDGPTHHGLADIGFLRILPNMVLAAPATAGEMKLAIEFAIAYDGPVCLRYPKDFVPALDDEPEIRQSCSAKLETGKACFIRNRPDSRLAIVSYGSCLEQAWQAAEQLAAEGIPADLVNARFASPIDAAIICLLQAGKGIITVEDHSLACGFGSAVLESAATAIGGRLPAPIVTLGVGNSLSRHDSRQQQLMQAGVNADNIAQAAGRMAAEMNLRY